MKLAISIKPLALAVLVAGSLACLPATYAQQAQQKKVADPADDVVRISTELVQTDLTVVDKRGRFVEGLRPDQFVLRLDGKPQSISFFELIKTGSAREAAQLAAARGDRLRDSIDIRLWSPAADK